MNLPRLLTTLALAIAGAFLLVGRVSRESAGEIKNNEVFYHLNAQDQRGGSSVRDRVIVTSAC